MLTPVHFLPIIQGTELEYKVGTWVIETALKQLQEWSSTGVFIEVSINISGDHIQETNFATHLEHQLQAYPNFSPGQLQIEILETIALNDFEQVSNTMAACQKLGISFALDDFGTGYSSLTYLRNLPTETIKIDQSFVRDMLEDDGDYAIVKGVLALSDTFKRKTVAEGIETEAQFQALKVMNCHSGQGYLFAQPMPAKDFLVWYHASKLS